MSDQDYESLRDLYQLAEQGREIRELVTRTHSTLLSRVDAQLSGIKTALLDMADPSSDEFKAMHMRGRVLGALFAEIKDVISEGNSAQALLDERGREPNNEGGSDGNPD
jgi:hypothetical protein